MATEAHGSRHEYNLLATFADMAAARRAAGALRLRGLDPNSYSIETLRERPGVDEARMRDELEGAAVGGPLVATGPMTKGAGVGAVAGVVVGAIVGLIVGALLFLGSGHSGSAVGLWATVIICAAALGVAGAMVGGFVGPRRRASAAPPQWAPESDVAPAVVLAVHVDDMAAMTASEEVLKEAEPLRLDRLSWAGEVLGTQSLGLDAPPVEPGSGRVLGEGEET
ncbi:MAG TPA: hypothetical protein VFW71_06960 [Actinomycetota bacterium]|nr:hypothetical protein [Actinomycetota bacterium]